MSELAVTFLVWFDGDDDPAEQLNNFEGALDGLKADGLIRQYISGRGGRMSKVFGWFVNTKIGLWLFRKIFGNFGN